MQAAERADDAHARAAQWPIYLRPAELPTLVCFQDSQRERERSDDGSLVVMLSPWARAVHGVIGGGRPLVGPPH